MRFDSTRAIETLEQLSEYRLQRTTVEPRTAAFLAEGFERAGWRVEQLEVSCRGVRAFFSRWLGIAFCLERLAIRTTRPPGSKSPVIVARPTVPSRSACRVVFLSNVGPLPSLRMAPRTSRPGDGSGPALLVEMARAWPKAWSERFEPLLVAAGGMNFGFAGVREMVRLIREEWDEKPTLVVVILAPGVGRELTIRGRPKALLRQSCEAAKSLWIPVESVGARPGMPMGRSWPVPSRFRDHIVLTGASYRDAKPPPVDPAALARAAQLASEIALRWVKHHSQQAVYTLRSHE
jgi:hypothetical protein